MGLVRTTAAMPALGAGTLFYGGTAIGAGLLHDDDAGEWAMRGWAQLVLRLAGARVRATGTEHIDPNGHYVFVSNHQSHLDIPSITASCPARLRYVAKKSLFGIPVFGQALTALGHIPVERGNRDQARTSLERAVEPLRTRVSVVFFAEGTRSETGELGRFKKGALVMAETAGVPVVPMAVSGTRAILPKGRVRFSPGPVGVAFLPPLAGMEDPARPRDERLAELRAAVERAMVLAEEVRRGDAGAGLV